MHVHALSFSPLLIFFRTSSILFSPTKLQSVGLCLSFGFIFFTQKQEQSRNFFFKIQTQLKCKRILKFLLLSFFFPGFLSSSPSLFLPIAFLFHFSKKPNWNSMNSVFDNIKMFFLNPSEKLYPKSGTTKLFETFFKYVIK